MIEMPRTQRVEVCQGALVGLLLPLMSQDPYNSYANALHEKIVAAHGENFASKSDVGFALKLMAQNGLATAHKENPDHHGSKVFYFPTFLGGVLMGMSERTSNWEMLGLLLDRKPAKKAA